MNIDFTGKVAVVTGAGSGIGFACADMLAQAGAVVAMVGRSAAKIEKAAAMLADKGEVRPYALDVSAPGAIAPVVERIRAELGEIGVLIQAAGVMSGLTACSPRTRAAAFS